MKMTEKQSKAVMPEMGIMIDCSRGAATSLPALRRMTELCSRMGYTFIGLYLEDLIKLEGEPYFGYRRGYYTLEEIREADAYAHSLGLELRPYIQTLAHLNQIADYADYADMIDTADILLAEEEKTYQLLDRLLNAVSTAFESRKVNIGMDEAHMVGLGKYLDRHGYTDRVTILLRHLDKVIRLCQKYGLEPEMWSDMFFRLQYRGEYYIEESDLQASEKIRIPDGLALCYWDYYSEDAEHYRLMIGNHQKMCDRISFAGGAWRWMGFAPYNRYSIRAMDAALQACCEKHLSSIVVTMWGDDGGECSIFALLPTLFLTARRAKQLWGIAEHAATKQLWGIAESDTTKQPCKTVANEMGVCPGEQNRKKLYSEEESQAFFELTGYTLDEFLRLDETNPFVKGGTFRNNLSKILLYNDPLLGIFDACADPEEMAVISAQFLETGRRLRNVMEKSVQERIAGKDSDTKEPCIIKEEPGGRVPEKREFDYLFRTQEALCVFLSLKADFGIRLRKAYQEKDRRMLRKIAESDIEELIRKLDAFYSALKTQWKLENKSYGLEVHTIRLGGLRQRLKDVREILLDYLEGRLERIEELEDPLLPPGYVFDDTCVKNLEFNRYEKMATTAKLSW